MIRERSEKSGMATPMMQQYMNVKHQVPDAILFFRLGDFYEMFGSDAETAAPILEIALTGRDAGEKQRIPMCGVPFHAVDNYLPKLIKAGYKVAICEQIGDPRTSKGIVKREIVRIVSPGTMTDNLPGEANNNFLASVYHEREWGLAFVDVTTGEFTIFQTPLEDVLFNELNRIHPAEILLPPDLARKSSRWAGYYRTPRERADFQQVNLLLQRFPEQEPLLNSLGSAAKAGAALWLYLLETLSDSKQSHILKINTYTSEERMVLDQWTRRNLELTESLRGQNRKGTLLSVLDLTKTAFGGRLLRNWLEQPLLQEKEITARLDKIEALTKDSFLRNDLIKSFTGIYDLERLMSKVSYGSVHARDLLYLAHTLQQLPTIRSVLENSGAPLLVQYVPLLTKLDDLADLLERAIHPETPVSLKEGNLIRPGFSAEIDELRSIAVGGKEWLAGLELAERERTGIRSLKIGYNKVFGYFIEVTHANASLVPNTYQRKQTLANAERYITPELKDFEQKILGAEIQLTDLEYEEFIKIRTQVYMQMPMILTAARALAELDVLTALAEAAVRYHYVRPQIRNDGVISITEGRHPVIEHMLEAGTFVPNDTFLSPGQHLAVITGPNMAGKSTYMRQTALLVLMAHIGSFLPAEKASISLVDRIFTRVGASDDLASGHSTFMVEMREVAHILRNAGPNSLIIFDEVGRGTATYDGLSIAWAVTEYINSNEHLKAKTLFATHYHELTQLAETSSGIFNLHVSVREQGEEIVFMHKILPGRSDRSYGIQVARLAGLPHSVLNRAKLLLKQLEGEAPLIKDYSEMKESVQLSFFENQITHPILQELSELNIEEISARQALEYLFDLRERLIKMDTF